VYCNTDGLVKLYVDVIAITNVKCLPIYYSKTGCGENKAIILNATKAYSKFCHVLCSILGYETLKHDSDMLLSK
jgi:hypothetical protein